MTIKVLYTIPNFITAGSGRALLNIAERLDRNAFSPYICISKTGGKLEEEIKQKGIPLIVSDFTVPALPYFTLPWRAWKAAQHFRKYQFDIWHSFHYLDDYTEPIIAKMAGAGAWIYTKKNMNWSRRSWFLRSWLASGIAAQNTDMMKYFFSGSKFRSKTRLIHRGVDVSKFSAVLSTAGHLREKFQIPGNYLIAGCVGQVLPVKGHMALIQSLVTSPGVFTLIAGSYSENDPYYASLQKELRQLHLENRVRFIGKIDDVPGFLSCLDMFIHPTLGSGRMEGCPVAVLEAMSCGRPCILSDIPGNRDLVVGGESGMLVPPESPKALSEAINTLAESPDLRKRFSLAARQHIEQQFSIEAEVKNHISMYQTILDR